MENIIVCPETYAAKAGEDIFARGGNAVDAAIGAAFVQGVDSPLYCGLGGGISLYYRSGRTGEEIYIKAESLTGSRPVPQSWIDEYTGETPGHRVYLSSKANEVGYQAVAVPGFVRGCWLAFERYGSGRLSWADILAPAIRLASEGIDLSPISLRAFEYVWARDALDGGVPRMHASPAAKALFHRHDGSRLERGDRLVQEELASTLEQLAAAGAEDFYNGAVADAISTDFEAHEGFITADDLATYSVEEDQPLEGIYHGMRLATQPYSNGQYLIEALQILEHFDLATFEHNGAEYVDLLGKVMRICYADHCRTDGLARDEKRALEAEIVGLDHAQQWAERLKNGHIAYLEYGQVVEAREHGTTALNAADEEGNIVSHNHSIGIGGSGVVTPGLGFLYNNDVQFYTPRPGEQRSLEPKKRFIGGGSPLAVFKDERPYMVLGAPCGTRIPTSILQSFLNAAVFEMDALMAVTAPRLHSEGGRDILLEYSFKEDVAQNLREMGNQVQRNRYHSRPQAILWRSDLNFLEAGSDPRCGGAVGAYPPYDWTKDFVRRTK